MTVLIGVLAGILYLLVDFGIFHLVCHSRSITEGYSLFLVLLWMSMSYGFTNFAWIWLWISKDRDLFLWSFLILLWWFVCPLLSATFSPADMPQIVIQRTTGDYHGYMAVILFLGYLALIVYNLWQREYAARINLVWLRLPSEFWFSSVGKRDCCLAASARQDLLHGRISCAHSL